MARQSQNFIMSVTVFNVLVLAVDHYDIDEEFLNALNWINLACTVIFGVEIMIKTFGMGPKRTYLDFNSGSGWNCFDLFLVIIAIPDHIAGGSSPATAFRSFRLMKLVRRFPSVATLFSALIGCLGEGVYVSLLLGLLIFIFSILGMMFFEARFPQTTADDRGAYRANFNSWFEALITCFVVITGDGWVGIMKEGMIATSAAMFIYFFILFLLGNFVLVNVIVAVILDKLDDAAGEAERLDATLKITGSTDGNCDGIYCPVLDGDVTPLWMRKGPEEGEDARYLYSSNAEHPTYIVWTSQFREDHEALLVSDVHNGKMPHDELLWRQSYQDVSWDDKLYVEEFHEEEDEGGKADEVHLMNDDVRKLSLIFTIEVPVSLSNISEAAGIRFTRNLHVVEVLEGGVGEKGNISVGLALVRVGLQSVVTLTEANEAYAQETRTRESRETAEPEMVTLVFDHHASDMLRWEEDENPDRRTFCQRLWAVNQVDLYGIGFLPSAIHDKLAVVVNSTAFDYFIITTIFFNVAFLALESGKPSHGLKKTLEISNYIFTVIFTIEMLLKIGVMGLWTEKEDAEQITAKLARGENGCRAYLRDPWNCLDGFVVITALAGLVPGADALKAFRSLRTMRLVIRSQQLRIVIVALVKTVPALGVGLAVCSFIFFVFAILGLSFFKGQLHICDGGRIDEYNEHLRTIGELSVNDDPWPYLPDREQCRIWGGTWNRATNAADHFDNIGNSLLTLFVVAIGEGWSSIMYSVMDTRGMNKSPMINASPGWAVFFVLFHVIGNFFCLNLVIGILISEFTNERRELDGTQGMHLSDKQQRFIQAEKAVLLKLMFKELPSEPEKDVAGIRKRCFQAVQHPNFDRIITLVIIASMIIFATVFYNQGSGWDDFQYWGNRVCSIIFIAEAVTKIVGLGPKSYFRENWNRFDFIIVLVSILDIANVKGLSGLSAIRVLRVGRLFRLVGKAKGLQKLFNTMFQGDNLYYFGNIGGFCMAIIFMFAVAGVSLFGTVERAEAIDQNLNFENVGFAMITLFTISTTEAWLNVRDGLMESEVVTGHIFSLLWIVVGSVVLLNLFAAVVVELFDKQTQLDFVSKQVESLEDFRDRWRDHFGKNCAEVTIEAFLEALCDHDTRVEVEGGTCEYELLEKRGILNWRLRAIPKPSYSVSTNVHMPRMPNQMHLLSYLAALGIPLRRRDGDCAVVTYRDAAFCFAARAFNLQEAQFDEIHQNKLTRAPKVSKNAYLAAHWLASRILQTNLKRSILSKKREREVDSLNQPSTNPDTV